MPHQILREFDSNQGVKREYSLLLQCPESFRDSTLSGIKLMGVFAGIVISIWYDTGKPNVIPQPRGAPR